MVKELNELVLKVQLKGPRARKWVVGATPPVTPVSAFDEFERTKHAEVNRMKADLAALGIHTPGVVVHEDTSMKPKSAILELHWVVQADVVCPSSHSGLNEELGSRMTPYFHPLSTLKIQIKR